MPLSTGAHSLLASTSATATTTTTLPSLLETDDHGRLNHQPLPQSKTLRPPTQPNFYSSSNGASHSITRHFNVDSTTSSPSTTTNSSSTLNSAVTEHSPASSSPQSPSSLLLQAPFKQPKLNTNLSALPMDQSRDDVSPIRPSTSASDSAAFRKGRNMKGLSINTAGISAKQNIDSRTAVKDGLAPRPVTQSGPAPTFKPGSLPPVSESAPVSPSFIIPKMPPRRKPSKLGLTIATPDTDQKAAIPPTPSFAPSFVVSRQASAPTQLQTIPQTPAFPPPLNVPAEAKPAHESLMSPSLGPPGGMSLPAVTGRELRTPGLAPNGGMTLPPFGSLENSPSKRSSPGAEQYRPLQDHMGLQRHRSADQIVESSSIVNQTIEHTNSIPTYDRPLSQEVKSPSYPDGPACIYPPNVYLYHQPTASEARNFDVVINVAREVCNPFEIEAEEEKARLRASDTQPIQLPKPSYRSVGVQVELLTEEQPKTAASESSFRSALDRLSISADEDVPPTPKVTKHQPEYLHLPWEHNSKVYEDWYDICQLIDERTNQGKKVLIHCQLGVSRSASLIVAYGIYQNPRLSPDEAREQAKSRSRWIDLNMHFMYELGDFKKLLVTKGVPGADVPRAGLGAGLGHKPMPLSFARSKTDTALLSPVQSVPNTPMSALSSHPPSAPLSGEQGKDGKFASVPENGSRTPGPSSAPSDVTWSPSKRPKGMEEDMAPPMPLPKDSMADLFSLDGTRALPRPLQSIARQPSPAQKTPGFDMPGGWAATPAMSRPTSMVFPEGSVQAAIAQAARLAEKTPQQSPAPSPEPTAESSQSADDKPTRTPSFRRLPRMPSLPSSFTNSIGSFFSLNRSASTSSKKTPSALPARQSSLSLRPQTRLDVVPPTPTDDAPNSDGAAAGTLRKPPSLPTLRTFFPLGGSGSDLKNSKPSLSLTLDPIPQSAIGGDYDAAASQDEDFAALMSPRAQEFVSNPFHRPATSHTVAAVPTANSSEPKPLGGFASMMSGFGQLRKKKSGQSLRNTGPLPEAANATLQPGNGPIPEMVRKASNGSHTTVVPKDLGEEVHSSDGTQELLSPGAQESDPRSPPVHGAWGSEERIMRNIDDVI